MMSEHRKLLHKALRTGPASETYLQIDDGMPRMAFLEKKHDASGAITWHGADKTSVQFGCHRKMVCTSMLPPAHLMAMTKVHIQ